MPSYPAVIYPGAVVSAQDTGKIETPKPMEAMPFPLFVEAAAMPAQWVPCVNSLLFVCGGFALPFLYTALAPQTSSMYPFPSSSMLLFGI